VDKLVHLSGSQLVDQEKKKLRDKNTQYWVFLGDFFVQNLIQRAFYEKERFFLCLLRFGVARSQATKPILLDPVRPE